MFLEVLTMQRVYKYITKVKNMPDHRLPKQAWSIGCKVQETNSSKIISSAYVVDIMKWFKRWGGKDLMELSSDSMKYMIVDDRLLGTLVTKWKDAKVSKLEYYIANSNPQCCPQYKVKMCEHIQLHLLLP